MHHVSALCLAIIAGFIIMEQYRYFGSMVEAISAYRHGRLGVLRDGLDARYVRKVYHGGLTEL